MNERLIKVTKTVAIYALVIVAGAATGWSVTHAKSWFTPDFQTGNYQSFFAKQGPQVAIYGTSWCPACGKARETLNAMGVAYSDFDIETSDEAKQKYLGTGESAIPVIFIQNRMFVGVDKSALESTVMELGLRKKALQEKQL